MATKKLQSKSQKKLPKNDALPSLLSHNADEVGLGAVLMRLDDNRRAVVVDSVMREGTGHCELIVAYVSDKAMRQLDPDGEQAPAYPYDPKDYALERIHCADSGWLVLALGPTDFDVLVD